MVASGRLGNWGFPGDGRSDGSREHKLETFPELLQDMNPEGQRMRVGCGIRAAGRFSTYFMQSMFYIRGDSGT